MTWYTARRADAPNMTDQTCIPGLEPVHEQHRQALPNATAEDEARGISLCASAVLVTCPPPKSATLMVLEV